MSEWKRVKISEVSDFFIGGTPSRSNPKLWAEKPSGHPWIAISDLKQKYVSDTEEHITGSGVIFSNVKEIPPESVVMSFKLSIGKAAITKRLMYCNEAIVFFKPYEELSSRWLYHAIPKAANAVIVDTAVKGSTLNKKKIADIELFLPGIEEQTTIATILDTLDTQIRQTEAIIAKLQQVKQGLLHDLLTRGIDENGQLRPPYEQAPELYKDSPLGWIPKEWKATELGNALSHIDAGRSPSCPDIPAPSGAWGVLKVSAVHPDGFKEQETKIVEQVIFHNPQIEVKNGDLLITRANTPELVGLPCLVSTERDRLMLSDKTLRLDFKEGQNKAFFFYVLTQSWVRSQIQVAATGTSMSMKNISQLSLKNLKVKQPPTTEQAKISQRVYESGRQIREETLLLEKIKKQKAGLMDDLLTGRVRVT